MHKLVDQTVISITGGLEKASGQRGKGDKSFHLAKKRTSGMPLLSGKCNLW